MIKILLKGEIKMPPPDKHFFSGDLYVGFKDRPEDSEFDCILEGYLDLTKGGIFFRGDVWIDKNSKIELTSTEVGGE